MTVVSQLQRRRLQVTSSTFQIAMDDTNDGAAPATNGRGRGSARACGRGSRGRVVWLVIVLGQVRFGDVACHSQLIFVLMPGIDLMLVAE